MCRTYNCAEPVALGYITVSSVLIGSDCSRVHCYEVGHVHYVERYAYRQNSCPKPAGLVDDVRSRVLSLSHYFLYQWGVCR